MFTRNDIVKLVNSYEIDGTYSWDDIKYHADKAISKINNHLGTIYPKMSRILMDDESTYSFRTQTTDSETGETLEVFERSYLSPSPDMADEYIQGIVVPFIATELFALNEEFTTVYNKCLIDVSDGLFDLFQKEFNRVPMAFRQSPEQGVFFGADSALSEVARNTQGQLPVYKFRVTYHANIVDANVSESFPTDVHAYSYGDEFEVLGYGTNYLYSADGTKAYQLLGWSKDPAVSIDAPIAAGEILTVYSDVNLYGVWKEESTLNISPDTGTVYIKDIHKRALTRLEIPDTINGIRVQIIPTDFVFSKGTNWENDDTLTVAEGATNLTEIILPKYLAVIKTNAFNGCQADTIVLPNTYVDDKIYRGLSIESTAFVSTPNLKEILIPESVTTISNNAFPVKPNVEMIIRVALLESNVPDTWNSAWYAESSGTYFVTIVWGYNG